MATKCAHKMIEHCAHTCLYNVVFQFIQAKSYIHVHINNSIMTPLKSGHVRINYRRFFFAGVASLINEPIVCCMAALKATFSAVISYDSTKSQRKLNSCSLQWGSSSPRRSWSVREEHNSTAHLHFLFQGYIILPQFSGLVTRRPQSLHFLGQVLRFLLIVLFLACTSKLRYVTSAITIA